MAVETPEFAAMLRRMIRAYGKRVADADDVDLTTMAELRDELEQAILYAIDGQRRRDVSWATIGQALGITRQGAFQRYGKPTMRTVDERSCSVCGLATLDGGRLGKHECRRGFGV